MTLKIVPTEVVNAALKVREWAEEAAPGKYMNRKTLCGMCAIASGELISLLTETVPDSKEKARVRVNRSHCYVTYDEYVIDVTATQFGVKERIMICHYDDVPDTSVWNHKYDLALQSKEELRLCLQGWMWPCYQIP